MFVLRVNSFVSVSALNNQSSESWLNKILSRKISPNEAAKESHSRMLSDKEILYALHTHNVRADSTQNYLNNYKTTVELIESKKNLACELVASWSVQVGDQDQFLHLWRYTGGFQKVDLAEEELKKDPNFIKLSIERGGLLRARHLQYLLGFSYWPVMEPRTGKNIYEMRSYRLKPGTMIEWGNNWARAINFRRNNNEAYAGFFSQIGRLYNVHHIWCYSSYQQRKETRENAWRQPGWDECVAYTVPLIREMHCRILIPTEFSPTK
ncbi:CLUMA_CG020979, isoform A [Clunio marinus]|uniref:CLUMA_CG020979, isoform A n=1 Tax=Clunio marinus TaxID=568069 RepID=A0A1J1J9B4_9DIPT|nr:CLUMA_CG020979, isoform A [Clunio marinus]